MYAKYDARLDGGVERRERMGWWMAREDMIPAAFGERRRWFACRGVVQTAAFLDGFLDACGVRGVEALVGGTLSFCFLFFFLLFLFVFFCVFLPWTNVWAGG